jgi:hypothetical protein
MITASTSSVSTVGISQRGTLFTGSGYWGPSAPGGKERHPGA